MNEYRLIPDGGKLRYFPAILAHTTRAKNGEQMLVYVPLVDPEIGLPIVSEDD